jgi:hypothetical protein
MYPEDDIISYFTLESILQPYSVLPTSKTFYLYKDGIMPKHLINKNDIANDRTKLYGFL